LPVSASIGITRPFFGKRVYCKNRDTASLIIDMQQYFPGHFPRRKWPVVQESDHPALESAYATSPAFEYRMPPSGWMKLRKFR
jgi:hypothetical protein